MQQLILRDHDPSDESPVVCWTDYGKLVFLVSVELCANVCIPGTLNMIFSFKDALVQSSKFVRKSLRLLSLFILPRSSILISRHDCFACALSMNPSLQV